VLVLTAVLGLAIYYYYRQDLHAELKTRSIGTQLEIYQNDANKGMSGAAFNSVAGVTAMGAQVSMILSKSNSVEEQDDLLNWLNENV